MMWFSCFVNGYLIAYSFFLTHYLLNHRYRVKHREILKEYQMDDSCEPVVFSESESFSTTV